MIFRGLLLLQKIGPKLKDEASKALHLEYSFVRCWKLDTSLRRQVL